MKNYLGCDHFCYCTVWLFKLSVLWSRRKIHSKAACFVMIWKIMDLILHVINHTTAFMWTIFYCHWEQRCLLAAELGGLISLPVTSLCSESVFCRHCRANLMACHNTHWLFRAKNAVESHLPYFPLQQPLSPLQGNVPTSFLCRPSRYLQVSIEWSTLSKAVSF